VCPVYQAVLIEHDEVVLSDLSAVVVSGGRKGDNLIKDYDQVTFLLPTNVDSAA